ncbi:hypothetical protein J4050_08225 [Winogradskyella sp. DF17]|uniref:Uncharacterized protein n=1 Tax=Winogradskyella pelagia TaxID=2819984 RepID=A0ABS3T1V2_9FLAO|nr:hypothetical protein [Winogradskyella sp. DF17]
MISSKQHYKNTTEENDYFVTRFKSIIVGIIVFCHNSNILNK